MDAVETIDVLVAVSVLVDHFVIAADAMSVIALVKVVDAATAAVFGVVTMVIDATGENTKVVVVAAAASVVWIPVVAATVDGISVVVTDVDGTSAAVVAIESS